jgi:hypothetical protein
VLVLVLSWLPIAAPAQPLHFRQTTIRGRQGLRWVAVADVNQDGNPDILVANADAGTLSVLLGKGAGQFKRAPGAPFLAGHEPNDIAEADMDCDGHPDVVIPNRLGGPVAFSLILDRLIADPAVIKLTPWTTHDDSAYCGGG